MLSVGPSAILLATLVMLSAYVLQPRIGIRDVDAYVYIVGAHSIKAGNGFVELNGRPITLWPPGYSLILSLFPDPIIASTAINYLMLGVAAAALYLLARQQGWPWQAALGLGLDMSFGFFRIMATNSAPDVAP